MAIKRGFLFLSSNPHRLAKRVCAEDAATMFASAVCCLTCVHITRGSPTWARGFKLATGREPTMESVARAGNEAQCDWAATTRDNYTWMCVVLYELIVQHTAVISHDATRTAMWFAEHIPFPECDPTLPTIFPRPKGVSGDDDVPTHATRTRDARDVYKAVRLRRLEARCQPKRPHTPMPRRNARKSQSQPSQTRDS